MISKTICHYKIIDNLFTHENLALGKLCARKCSKAELKKENEKNIIRSV